MKEPFFIGSETSSNHGTSQGILPRFFLQMYDLAQFALIDKKVLDEKFAPFSENNVSDFTDFYDLFQDIKTIYNEYLNGLKSRKYYSIDENGSYHHDRTQELILKKKIKDFFILGRLLINNFAKSEIIDDNKIVLNDLLIVNDKNFQKNKSRFLENKEGISYKILFQIIEDSRNEFLNTFNQIRADIEHNNLQIGKFLVKIEKGEIKVKEPSLIKYKLIEELEIFYERILEFIEILMAYYYGLNAYQRTDGFLTLFQRKEYDYTALKYRFVIKSRIGDDSLILLIN